MFALVIVRGWIVSCILQNGKCAGNGVDIAMVTKGWQTMYSCIFQRLAVKEDSGHVDAFPQARNLAHMQSQAVFYATLVKEELRLEFFTIVFKPTRGVGTSRRQKCRRRLSVLSNLSQTCKEDFLDVQIQQDRIQCFDSRLSQTRHVL